ncbi:MAG: alanine dehydrogenase [Flavobacteriaceae bacterium CG_4_8_14_3_um_filter_34_10]|nr:alanine dehydrogenase [Flavobacteriia bacterium]OIP49310.1 MAG: alanine dehydrogenase [Flavobacteriaceae bacterium CG2_30_34_30]PIX10074.1 MAG: alanine dehydrogenase [Flavobacteriaceae bacterium CG_4_8_14_3_um_filter_34_10]PIZ06847.1 MAG: alanine dehydrogenase [Flavobacteriaceae bacterium CG_4_10_14_0_8_um_filter_34_31]PJC08130.1 MAG: alanine dehydrogenase [Flavobacteriaceae bacterium CG_4_9_14_0_8_um_filter_34_30]
MTKPSSPFTAAQLLPQEEMLEIQHTKGELYIGIPKEIEFQERRICLTPDAVSALVSQGHKILMEHGAGNAASFLDAQYSEAGAQLTNDTKKVFSCPIVLKVEPPTLNELEMMQAKSVLISALQIKTRQKSYFETLAKKKITALAFEFLNDENGAFPVVRALSEIAGTASILIAAELMANAKEGNGLMFGNISGVPPVEVLIIGAGTVGEFAARSAIGLGASVKIFDNNITKLRCLQTNLGRTLFTSTLQPKNLLKALKRCDVAIGAIRGKNRSPIVVSRTMVEHMKKGSVIIDVSIDMGGCFETSETTTHKDPTLIKNGVIHYGVPNIPARYPKTASISISNIFTPYLIDIAESGGIENAIRFDNGLKNGLYFYRGILTNKSISDWFDMPYSDINLFIF